MRALAILTAAVIGPAETHAQQPAFRSEWRAGIEVGPRPGLVAAWESFVGPWGAGAALTLGPGEDPVRLRATPHVRLVRAFGRHLRLAGGLGLEWARLGRSWNRDESEISWELAAGWRTSSSLLLEAAARWTDFARLRRWGVLRMSAPFSVSRLRPRRLDTLTDGPPLPQDLGVPDAIAEQGRLSVNVPTVEREGRGMSLLAANPRGDPAPGASGEAANMDRLAMGGELWAAGGGFRGWGRWTSDLHTDPSISARTRSVAEGLSFPTSVSFSGGGAWRPEDERSLEISARHAPQLLLWMPHLASERTAGATVVSGVFRHGETAFALEGRRVAAISGRTVDPLDHFRGALTGLAIRRFRVGLEHERVATLGDVDGRTRMILERDGAVRLRFAAGTDVAASVAGDVRIGDWTASGSIWYRSRPDPLHFDALLARGWSTETATGPAQTDGLAGVHVDVRGGPLEIEVRSLMGEPVWRSGSVSRAAGGWVEATWTDTLSFLQLHGRVRLASWGPETAWWKEAPRAAGRVGFQGGLGVARVRAWAMLRSKLHSARAAMSEPLGGEVGLGMDVPLPDLGSLRGMTARMELDDVLDHGVPIRPGAPRRGRRLTVELTWNHRGQP